MILKFLIFKGNSLSDEEKVIFSPIETTVRNLIRITLGKHEILDEKPDVAKQILACLHRVNELLSLKNTDPLASAYKEFFIITQFAQSSFRASQGTFLEKIFALSDSTQRIGCGVTGKNWANYLLNPELFWKYTLKLYTKDEKREYKKIIEMNPLKFKSIKLTRGKIDLFHHCLDNNTLILAEQRSRVNTGGTSAAQSNFEKANLFLSELNIWAKNENEAIDKFLKVLKEKEITNVLFLSAGVFAENGDWGTSSTDPQLSAKKNEFGKIKNKALELVRDFPKIYEIIGEEENAFVMKINEFEILMKFQFEYGLKYLEILLNETVTGDEFIRLAQASISDDFWVTYRVSVYEQEFLSQYNKNHINELLKFINSNRSIAKEWTNIKSKFLDKKGAFDLQFYNELDRFLKTIILEYTSKKNWELTIRISSKLSEQISYLTKVLTILFAAEYLKIIEFEIKNDYTLNEFTK